MRTIYRSEPRLYVGSPCRTSYVYDEIRTDGRRIIGAQFLSRGGPALKTYEPSPIWLAAVAAEIGGYPYGDIVRDATERDLQTLRDAPAIA